MWHDMDPIWLVKQVLQFLYVTAVADIISRRGLIIEVHQPNKSKLAPFKLWIHFNSCLKQLYISNKAETRELQL